MVTPGTWEWELARLLGGHWYAIETLLVFVAFVTWRRMRKASQGWIQEAMAGFVAVMIGWIVAWGPGYQLLKAALHAMGVFDRGPFMLAVTVNLLAIDAALLAGALAMAKSSAGKPPRAAP